MTVNEIHKRTRDIYVILNFALSQDVSVSRKTS